MNDSDLRMLRSVLTGGLSNLWPSPGRKKPGKSKDGGSQRPQGSDKGEGKEQRPPA